jgi:hypothetical protein
VLTVLRIRRRLIKNKKILYLGIGASIVLFILFTLLNQWNEKILLMPDQWIFIVLAPIVIALFAGGYIARFK